MSLLCCRSIFLHRCSCFAEVYSDTDVVVVLQKYQCPELPLSDSSLKSCSRPLLRFPSTADPPQPLQSQPISSPDHLTRSTPLPMSMQAVEMKKSCYTSQFETSLCQAHQPCTWKGSPSHLCAPDFCSSRVHVCVIRIKGKEKEKKNKKTTTTHCDKGHAEMGPFPFTLSDDGILFACTLS